MKSTIKRLLKVVTCVLLCCALEYCVVQWYMFTADEYVVHTERLHEMRHKHLMRAHRAPHECQKCTLDTSLPEPHVTSMCVSCNATGLVEIPVMTDRTLNGERYRAVQRYFAVSPLILKLECHRETSWWCYPFLYFVLKATLQCPTLSVNPVQWIAIALMLWIPVACFKYCWAELDRICHDKYRREQRLANQEASNEVLARITSIAPPGIGESPSILPPNATAGLNFQDAAFQEPATNVSRTGLNNRHFASAQALQKAN